mgnify:CR=1 FL=1
MVHFNDGSLVYKIISVLSFTGEFPSCSLKLLGKERVVKELVHKLTLPQLFHNDVTGDEHAGKLLVLSGKGREKTVRFYKGALEILHWIHPDAYGYYMSSFRNHKFPGDAAHKERNHRVAESVAVCMDAGVETVPYLLPKLQTQVTDGSRMKRPSFYLGKDIKKTGQEEMNKTKFTRMTGAIFSDGGFYAVYNTRGSVMKWNGMGEFKAMHSMMEIGRMNAGGAELDSAILIGKDYTTALNTILASEEKGRKEFRFDSIYRHIYFICMDGTGICQMKLLLLQGWKRRLSGLLFEEEECSEGQGSFEYDAFVDGVYVFSFLDSDIARLLRFKSAVIHTDIICEVLCFPYQLSFLKEYLGDVVRYKTIGMDLVAGELGI